MGTKHYENGIIATTESGDIIIYSDIFVTGSVFWVNSVGGSDANAGTNRTAPKATLAGAITAATANNGDVIIIESGHTETSASSIALSKAGIKIFGLGTGSSKPSFTCTGAVDLFNVTGARVGLYNLRFPVGTTATNTSRVNINAVKVNLKDCDFLCGVQDLESVTITASGTDAEIDGCSFTISADGPDSAIRIESASSLGVKIISSTFDGGSVDFDDAAIYSTVAHTEFFYDRNTLINKASIIHTAAAKGICTGTIAGDTSRVEI